MRAVPVFCFLLMMGIVSAESAPPPIPVIFDTDIGTDIDDAYALAPCCSVPISKCSA